MDRLLDLELERRLERERECLLDLEYLLDLERDLDLDLQIKSIYYNTDLCQLFMFKTFFDKKKKEKFILAVYLLNQTFWDFIIE